MILLKQFMTKWYGIKRITVAIVVVVIVVLMGAVAAVAVAVVVVVVCAPWTLGGGWKVMP